MPHRLPFVLTLAPLLAVGCAVAPDSPRSAPESAAPAAPSAPADASAASESAAASDPAATSDAGAAPADSATAPDAFEPLFPTGGVPAGWVVTSWSDLGKPPPEGAVWEVRDGVLHGSATRGTWLVSEREYDDFELAYEFQLGPTGNSGCALRAPMRGDPAFDGLELQMADFRYNTEAKPSELTGGLYRAVAPREQVYRPEEWNEYRIRLEGAHVHVTLNDTVILDIELDDYQETVPRHDGSPAPPLAERPRRGHLGFQELSRGGDHVRIRNARLRELRRP